MDPAQQFPTFGPSFGDTLAPLTPAPAAPTPVRSPPPQSALRNIWNGLAGGIMGGFPTMAGEALQKFAPAGGSLEAAGKSIADFGKTADLSYRVDPDSMWGQAAHGVGSFAPALAAAPLAVAAGVPGALAAGASGLAGALLAGGSAAKEKEDEVLAAGGTPEMARTRGNQEGALQGAVQGIMAAIPGGRILGGVGQKAVGALGKMVGAKIGGQTVLDSFANPSTVKAFLGNSAEMAVTGIPLMMGAAAESSHLDQNKGFGFPDSSKDWEAARASFAPSAAMTTMMAPFGFLGAREAVKAKQQTAALVTQAPDTQGLAKDEVTSIQSIREKAILRIAKQMRQVSPEEANTWQLEAMKANADNLPIDLDVNFTAADAKAKAQAPAQPPAQPPAENRPAFELNGGQEKPFELTQPGENTVQEQAQRLPEAGAPKQGELDLRPQGTGELPVTREPTQRELPGFEEWVNRSGKPPPDEPPGGGGVPRATDTKGQTELDLRDTATRRKDILKENVGTVPQDVRDRLISVDDPEAIPQTLWEVWSDKGGTGATAAYVKRLGDFYEKITGKDIEDHEGVTTNAKPSEATAPTDQGAKPEPAPVQAGREAPVVGEQVGETQGGRATGNENDGNAPTTGRSEEAGGIASATVRFGGQEFDAPTHPQAVKLADAAGKMQRDAQGRPVLGEGDSINLFRTNDGKVISREDAQALVGAKRTEEMQPLGAEKAGGVIKAPDVIDRDQVPEHARAVIDRQRERDGPMTREQARDEIFDKEENGYPRDTGVIIKHPDGTYSVSSKYDVNPDVHAELQGEDHAATPGQSSREVNTGTNGARVTPALNEAENRNSGVGGTQGEGGGQAQVVPAQKGLTDSEFYAKMRSVVKKNGKDLDRVEAQLKRTTDPVKKQQLTKQLAELSKAHQAALKISSDALNRIESKKSGPEPFARKDNYAVLSLPYDEHAGLSEPVQTRGGANPEFEQGNPTNKGLQIQKWLEARIVTGRASDAEKELYAGLSGYKPTAGDIDAATAALAKMSPELKAKYAKATEIYAGIAKTHQDALSTKPRAKEATNKIVKAARLSEEHVMEGESIVAERRANNEISDAEAHKLIQGLQDYEPRNRALAELDDAPTVEQLDKSRNAHDLMEFYAQNHSDPVARALAKIIAKTGVTARIVDDPTRVGASYDPATNTILRGRGGSNPITMMHETWHAATHSAIARGIDGLARFGETYGKINYTGTREPRNEVQAYIALSDRQRTLSPRAKAEMTAVQVVRDTMAKFRSVADFNNIAHVNALKDEHEFVAEANSNPDFARLLDKRGWLQTMFDKLRDALGISREHKDNFDRFQKASQTLVGMPDRRMGILDFGYARDEKSDPSPIGRARMMSYAARQNAGVADKITRFWHDGVASTWNKKVLPWLTLRHLEATTDRLLDIADREHPGLKPFTDIARGGFRLFRDAMNRGKSDMFVLRNGENENQKFIYRHLDAETTDRSGKRAMNKVLTSARRTGVFPWAKTYEEAHGMNSEVTKEIFAHSVSQENAKAWGRLSPEHQQLAKDTLMHYQRERVRRAASMLRQYMTTYKTLDIPEIRKDYENLSWRNHRVDENGDMLTPTQQHDRLLQAIKTSQSTMEKLAGTEEKPSGHERAKDVDSLQTDTFAMMRQFYKEHDRPYVPLGRIGPHFIRATIGGGQAEWDRVRRIVTGDMNTSDGGGLGREMEATPIGGNRNLMMRFDSDLDFTQASKALKPLLAERVFHVEDKNTYSEGSLEEKTRSLSGATAGFMDNLVSRIRSDPDIPPDMQEHTVRTMYDSWLQMMPETSPLKAHMSSDNTSGNMDDLTHAIVNASEASSHMLTSIERGMALAEAQARMKQARRTIEGITGNPDLQGMKKRFTESMDELNIRASWLQGQIPDYNKVIQNAKSITAAWDLALSPAYIMMVGYQPWQISMPAIGKKYGMVRTAAAMARNTAQAWSILNQTIKQGWLDAGDNNVFNKANRASDIAINARKIDLKKGGPPLFNEQRLDLLNKLVGNGLINFGMAAQLYRLSPDAMNPFQKGMRIAQIAPHYIEMANRIATALTAHEMATSRGQGKDKLHDNAVDYAMQMIRDTDGDHSQTNIARRLGRRGIAGQATPLLVGFGQYDIQMSEFLTRQMTQAFSSHSTKEEKAEARKGLAGTAAMTGLISGALGLPFMGIVTGIYNAAMQMYQQEGETPPDLEHSIRIAMGNMFGKEGGEIVSRGAPRALNFDMSGRSGYQDLFPFTSFLTDRSKLQDRIGNGLANLAGPSVGILSGIAEGAYSYFHDENVPAAINQALPAALRNAAKAYRLANYGEEQTSGANTQIPIKTDGWDVMARSMGLTSSKKAEYTEANYANIQREKILEARHTNIQNQFERAANAGDIEAMQRIAERAFQFGREQPQFANFNFGEVLAQQRQKQAIGAQQGGVMMTPRQVPYYQNFQATGNSGLPQF